MFLHRARETMMALGVGDEIIEIAIRRVHGRCERAASRIRDGTGRKSGIVIGVVRRLELHVGVVQRALVSASQ